LTFHLIEGESQVNKDVVALLLSFGYVFLMIGIAEGLRKWRKYSVDFTRKFIHIAVGMWAYGTVLLFERREFAIIPPLVFIGINALSYWRGTFKAMETGEKGQLGTIYFPLSFTVITWLLWDRPHLLVAGLMPMTWGDALAAIVGQRIGKRWFSVGKSTRSFEGSLAMFFSGWLATFIPLILLPSSDLALLSALGLSALTALAAAIIEGISPWGIDNLTVPAVSALALVIM
jgi:phytol kinase